jgi:hypothetical protein
LLKDNQSINYSNEEEIKVLRPLAKLKNISNIVIEQIKWTFNDIFLIIISDKNELVILDALLYAYGTLMKK